MKPIAGLFTALAAVGIADQGAHAQTPTDIRGAWVFDGGETSPQRGLLVFTDTHYSMMFVRGAAERARYPDDRRMTDAETVAAYNSITANSGTYTLTGDRVTLRAYLANDPNYMGDWPANDSPVTLRVVGDAMTWVEPDMIGLRETVTLRRERGAILPSRAVGNASPGPDWVAIDPEYTLYIDVPDGRIVVALTKDFAPGHVSQLRALARERFYDGLQFYRVIEGFVAQGGDYSEQKPIRTGQKTLKAEFEQPWSNGLPFVPLNGPDEFGEQAGYVNGFAVRHGPAENRVWLTRCPGVMGLGRYDDPDTAAADFWFALRSIRGNDRNDTVFGRVVWGMEHLSRMQRTGPVQGDSTRWTTITSVRVAADLPEADRIPLEMMNSNSQAFQDYLEERRNPGPGWFIHRPRRIELCSTPVPVRRITPAGEERP